MPIIAPLEESHLDPESRDRIAAGLATGMYTTERAPAALRAMDEGYKAMFRRSLLDDRLCELLRLKSAQINGCAPCSASRKEGSITEEEVSCLTESNAGANRRERLALSFLALMATNHHAISADTYRELAEEFSAAEIVELGWTCSSTIAGHRFIHTLDVLGEGKPIIA